MAIERGNFDDVCDADIRELVEAQVAESLRLEFKRSCYGKTDASKRELLKDVSAFANSHGGHLVLGIEEKRGSASNIVGISNIDQDAEILRMEQIIRNGIEPSIAGVRIKSVLLDSDNHVIIIRIPRSWNPPHRVTAQGSNRFYIRHSAGVHEPSVEELRVLFTQAGSALDQARQFRADRLRLIQENYGIRPLVAGGRLLLHIIPVAAFSGMINLDIELVHKQHAAFRPLGGPELLPRFNYHGFVNERGGDQNHGYTQVFRNGILEATKASIVSEGGGIRFVRGIGLGDHIFEVLSLYIYGLRDVGVPPPLIIMLTLEGIQGARFVVKRNPWDDYEPPIPDDILFLPECVLENFGTELDHHIAIRPAFDALWNASGFSKSFSFDENGRWSRSNR